MRALLQDLDTMVLHKVMDVNFWGTVYCTKYALPYLLQTKGSVAGIISIAGFIGLPGRTGYAASKFAVRGFLNTVRIENRKKACMSWWPHPVLQLPIYEKQRWMQMDTNKVKVPEMSLK